MAEDEVALAADYWSGCGLTVTVPRSDVSRAMVRVVGELDLASAPYLRSALDQQLASGRRFVRLDLSGVTFLDAAGLSVLVSAHCAYLAERGTVLVTGAGPRTRRLMQIVGVAELLLVAPEDSWAPATVDLATAGEAEV